MAEWLKAHAWKACVRETVPWVRIPLSPPSQRSHLFAIVRHPPEKSPQFWRLMLSGVRAGSPQNVGMRVQDVGSIVGKAARQRWRIWWAA